MNRYPVFILSFGRICVVSVATILAIVPRVELRARGEGHGVSGTEMDSLVRKKPRAIAPPKEIPQPLIAAPIPALGFDPDAAPVVIKKPKDPPGVVNIAAESVELPIKSFKALKNPQQTAFLGLVPIKHPLAPIRLPDEVRDFPTHVGYVYLSYTIGTATKYFRVKGDLPDGNYLVPTEEKHQVMFSIDRTQYLKTGLSVVISPPKVHDLEPKLKGLTLTKEEVETVKKEDFYKQFNESNYTKALIVYDRTGK